MTLVNNLSGIFERDRFIIREEESPEISKEKACVRQIIKKFVQEPLNQDFSSKEKQDQYCFKVFCSILVRYPACNPAEPCMGQIRKFSSYVAKELSYSCRLQMSLLTRAFLTPVERNPEEVERLSIPFSDMWRKVFLNPKGVFITALVIETLEEQLQVPFCFQVCLSRVLERRFAPIRKNQEQNIKMIFESVFDLLQQVPVVYLVENKLQFSQKMNVQLMLSEKYSEEISILSQSCGRLDYKLERSLTTLEARLFFEFVESCFDYSEGAFVTALGYEALRLKEGLI